MTRQLMQSVYDEFVRFIAIPYIFRVLKTQEEFQLKYGVSHTTLAAYKKLPNFWIDVNREFNNWAKEHTPNVMSAVMVRAIKEGDPKCASIWLAYVEKFGSNGGNQSPLPDDSFEIPEARRELIMQAFTNFGLLEKQNDTSNTTTTTDTGNNNAPADPKPDDSLRDNIGTETAQASS